MSSTIAAATVATVPSAERVTGNAFESAYTQLKAKMSSIPYTNVLEITDDLIMVPPEINPEKPVIMVSNVYLPNGELHLVHATKLMELVRRMSHDDATKHPFFFVVCKPSEEGLKAPDRDGLFEKHPGLVNWMVQWDAESFAAAKMRPMYTVAVAPPMDGGKLVVRGVISGVGMPEANFSKLGFDYTYPIYSVRLALHATGLPPAVKAMVEAVLTKARMNSVELTLQVFLKGLISLFTIKTEAGLRKFVGNMGLTVLECALDADAGRACIKAAADEDGTRVVLDCEGKFETVMLAVADRFGDFCSTASSGAAASFGRKAPLPASFFKSGPDGYNYPKDSRNLTMDLYEAEQKVLAQREKQPEGAAEPPSMQAALCASIGCSLMALTAGGCIRAMCSRYQHYLRTSYVVKVVESKWNGKDFESMYSDMYGCSEYGIYDYSALLSNEDRAGKFKALFTAQMELLKDILGTVHDVPRNADPCFGLICKAVGTTPEKFAVRPLLPSGAIDTSSTTQMCQGSLEALSIRLMVESVHLAYRNIQAETLFGPVLSAEDVKADLKELLPFPRNTAVVGCTAYHLVEMIYGSDMWDEERRQLLAAAPVPTVMKRLASEAFPATADDEDMGDTTEEEKIQDEDDDDAAGIGRSFSAARTYSML